MHSKIMPIYKSYSFTETKKQGELLAKKILSSARKSGGIVFALQGNLGAGKTTFTQGFVRGLGLKKRVASPTFILMRRTAIPKNKKKFKNVYHVDAYRAKSQKELKVLELEAIFKNPENIVLIEWAEKIKKILPKNTKWIYFSYGKKENERTIRMNL